MKKSYSDYPNRFLEFITHFEKSDSTIHHTMTYREAISTRHSFYRFLSSIRLAADEGDAYAVKIRSLARNISISVIPARAEPDANVDICIYINPLEIGRANEPEEITSDIGDIIPLDTNEIERLIADKRRK